MKYNKNKLSNGSSLITLSIPFSPSVTIASYVKAGFRSDPIGKPGLAHFAEHMLFAGSKKYPSHYLLASQVEKFGGWHYAHTWIDYQQHEICLPYQYAGIGTEILLDTLFYSLVDKSELIKEKEVIKKEILRYRYEMDRFLFYYVWFPLVFQGTKLADPCIGTEAQVEKYKGNDIKKFIKTNFVPENMVFLASGNISEADSSEMFEKKLRSVKTAKEDTPILNILPKTNRKILTLTYESDQIGIAIGIKTVPASNNDKYIFEIIENMFSRGFGGSISDKLRERGGLIYSIYSSQENLLDSGYLVFMTMTEKKNALTVIQIIIDEFTRINKGNFSQEEVDVAIQNLIGTLQIGLETSSEFAHWYGIQELMVPNQVLHQKEKIGIYNKIKREDIVSMAQKYFTKDNIYVGILGELKQKDIEALL